MEKMLRAPAEERHASELARLKEAATGARPPGWRLAARATRRRGYRASSMAMIRWSTGPSSA